MATAGPTGCSWSPWAFLGLSQQKAEASRTTLEALAVRMSAGANRTNSHLGWPDHLARSLERPYDEPGLDVAGREKPLQRGGRGGGQGRAAEGHQARQWVSVVLSAEEYERLKQLDQASAPSLGQLLLEMPQDDEGFMRLPVAPRDLEGV